MTSLNTAVPWKLRSSNQQLRNALYLYDKSISWKIIMSSWRLTLETCLITPNKPLSAQIWTIHRTIIIASLCFYLARISMMPAPKEIINGIVLKQHRWQQIMGLLSNQKVLLWHTFLRQQSRIILWTFRMKQTLLTIRFLRNIMKNRITQKQATNNQNSPQATKSEMKQKHPRVSLISNLRLSRKNRR